MNGHESKERMIIKKDERASQECRIVLELWKRTKLGNYEDLHIIIISLKRDRG